MVKGLIGIKKGMTQLFMEDGTVVPCTVIEAGPCVVTQVKTVETDGYVAVQLGFGEKKAKNTTKPMLGHFQKAGTTPKAKLVEFRDWGEELPRLGQVISIKDVFQEGDIVDVTGKSKGRGFQGVVKRHGFSGVGMQTHGQKDKERHPGSIGASTNPARVVKGKRMGGRMGGERVTVKGLRIVKIDHERNLLFVKGSVPGYKGSFVIVKKREQ